MSLRKWSYKFYREPKWAIFWYLMVGTLCSLTCLVLSRTGYLPWDDVTALLLGFFVPIVVYAFKEIMRWYEYPIRYGRYAITEKHLELAIEYIENERWEEALENLNLILREIPGHLRALYYAAVCMENMGNNRAAFDNITEYLNERPDDAEALELKSRVGAASGI